MSSTSGNFINEGQTLAKLQVSDTDNQTEELNITLCDQESPPQTLDTSISVQNTPLSNSKLNKKNPKMTNFQSKLLNHLNKQNQLTQMNIFLNLYFLK